VTKLTPLAQAQDRRFGGKATGLARLLRLGLAVPEGWVVVPDGPFDADLPDGQYAVRSSAVDEDGAQASFAGQYETFLHVSPDGVAKAVADCEASARGGRVQAYAAQRLDGADTRIAVVIQRMVPAALAGVMFTVDPVTGRRDRWLIDTVDGVGEALVSGEADGRKCWLNRKGEVVRGESPGPFLAELIAGAQKIQDDLGGPVDIEWAVDGDGKLWWLQARPVTALSTVHPNELDDAIDEPGAVYTRANIGEMMPGPVTPLTASVFGRGIERGMQDYFIRVGAQDEMTEAPHYIFASHSHLFIRLDAVYASARTCLLASKEDCDRAIVGRVVSEASIGHVSPWWVQAKNFVKLIRYLNDVPNRMAQLDDLARSWRLKDDGTIALLTAALTEARDVVVDAYAHHYASSVMSGTWLGVLLGSIAGRGDRTPEHLATVSELLSDIPDVESADAVRALEALAEGIIDSAREEFLTSDAPDIWLATQAPEAVRSAYANFLQRHGHRCLREAELREPAWEDEPIRLAKLLQTRVRVGRRERQRAEVDVAAIAAKLPSSGRRTLHFALPRARRAVASREITKSAAIRVQHEVKKAYRALGERLVADGFLPDADLVYFFTHAELVDFAETGKGLDSAKARREQFEDVWDFEFPEISVGLPDPLEIDAPSPAEGTLRGVPVSRGTVEGRAVVANNLDDASRLEPGDILIARTTDVGWTPWFAIAGGIVTEVGSPISHGAVVAREYGIPAVVSVKGALGVPDGARVRLDAREGTLTVL